MAKDEKAVQEMGIADILKMNLRIKLKPEDVPTVVRKGSDSLADDWTSLENAEMYVDFKRGIISIHHKQDIHCLATEDVLGNPKHEKRLDETRTIISYSPNSSNVYLLKFVSNTSARQFKDLLKKVDPAYVD